MPEPTINYFDRKVERAIKLYDKGIPFNDFPADLRELFERWNIAHQIKLKYQHKGDEFVREIFRLRFDLDDTTARQDLRASELFFGKTKQTNRNYERILRIEFLKKASYKAYSLGKYKEAAQFEAILQKYLDPAHDPIDMPDWEEMRTAVQPTIVFEPELLGIERLSQEKKKQLWLSVQSKRSIDIDDAEIIESKPLNVDRIEDEHA